MNDTLRHLCVGTLSLGLLLVPTACATDDGGGSTGETTTDDADATGDGDPTTAGDGDGDPTTAGDGDGDPTTTGDGDGDPTTTGDGDGDPTTTGDGDGGDGDPAECVPGAGAAGSSCASDAECDSCNCYTQPGLGGQCGECNEDADCAETTMGGCTPSNPFDDNSGGSICNMGELGGGCESDAVCQDGLTCSNVLSLLGVEIDTCGECASDADCVAQICAPVVDPGAFSGANVCMDPGILPQDSFCDLDGNGDQACMSGICSAIDIMNLAQFGACGECDTDADCMMGQTCEAGEFDLDTGTIAGSSCI